MASTISNDPSKLKSSRVDESHGEKETQKKRSSDSSKSVSSIESDQQNRKPFKNQVKTSQNYSDNFFDDMNQINWSKLSALKNRKEDKESRFERLLKLLMKKGQKIIAHLPPNIRAKFRRKSDDEWDEFFERLLQNEFIEIEDEWTSESLDEILFRGTYSNKKKQSFLIVDISRQKRWSKFLRLSPDLLASQDFSEGDVVSLAQLPQKFSLIQLKKKFKPQVWRSGEDILQELKSPSSTELSQSWERRLAIHQESKNAEKKSIEKLKAAAKVSESSAPSKQNRIQYWILVFILFIFLAFLFYLN